MKTEILQILQMQQDGKLTQAQAAELLAVLAGQSRETDGGNAGATGPRAAKETGGGIGFAAAATLHSLMETAVGVGTTVGRAATVWGSELVQMVHREVGGNRVTLSKVEEPTGEAFVVRDNMINVSKVGRMTLNHAQVANNAINASQVADVEITHGRLTQCNMSGSSINQVTVTGEEGKESALRGNTFNATKFSRVKVLGGSVIDATMFQAAAVKDVTLADGSEVRDSRIAESTVMGLTAEKGMLRNLTLDRANCQGVAVKASVLDRVIISCVKVSEARFDGSTLTGVRFGRDPLGTGSGGRDSSLQETRVENCTISECNFIGCVFRRTVLKGLTLNGLTIRNVDFTGMTLETVAAFKQAAGLV